MADPLRLIGFEHSVYTWVVRFAMAEMGLTADYIEANPFADPVPPQLTQHTPLRRVPVLLAGQIALTETDAILRYLDAISGRRFQPADPVAAARMDQIMGIVDADIYPICVRQVFSSGFYHPHVLGQPGDAGQLTAGLERAEPPLRLLETIAQEGTQLRPGVVSLADFHLAPMLSYFGRVPAGAALLASFDGLSAWWSAIRTRVALCDTDPMAGF